MLSGLLGKKVGMTQVFTAQGAAIPVTVIEAGPCTVTQLKTAATDGYEAVQIGFGTAKHATRPHLGHLGHTLAQLPAQRRKQQLEQAKARAEAREKAAQAKTESKDKTAEEAEEEEAEEAEETEETNLETQAEEAGARGEEQAKPSTTTARTAQRDPQRRRPGGGLGPFQVLREVQTFGDAVKIGQQFDATMFRLGELVDVVGTSKGKGFQGVMKRHGFRGGPRTHGQSDRARAPGSIGAGNTPGRILKNTRMAGHMGNKRITVKRLEVVAADAERNVLLVRGSVPGPTGGLVMVQKVAESIALAERLQQQQQQQAK